MKQPEPVERRSCLVWAGAALPFSLPVRLVRPQLLILEQDDGGVPMTEHSLHSSLLPLFSSWRVTVFQPSRGSGVITSTAH